MPIFPEALVSNCAHIAQVVLNVVGITLLRPLSLEACAASTSTSKQFPEPSEYSSEATASICCVICRRQRREACAQDVCLTCRPPALLLVQVAVFSTAPRSAWAFRSLAHAAGLASKKDARPCIAVRVAAASLCTRRLAVRKSAVAVRSTWVAHLGGIAVGRRAGGRLVGRSGGSQPFVPQSRFFAAAREFENHGRPPCRDEPRRESAQSQRKARCLKCVLSAFRVRLARARYEHPENTHRWKMCVRSELSRAQLPL